MSALTFTHIGSVLFGAFALYVSARSGLGVARADHWTMFSMIRVSIGLVAGGAMIASGWFVPAIRRLAERTTDGPIRFSLSIVMVVVLVNARLSQTGGLWTMVPIAAFLAAFVVPGTAFRGLASPEIDEAEITQFEQGAMRELGKRWPILRSVSLVVFLLMLLSILSYLWNIFGGTFPVLQAPTWDRIAWWSSLVFGLVAAGLFFGIYIVTVPARLRAVAMPRYLLMATVSMPMMTVCMLSFLHHNVPVTAARFWGTEVTRPFLVVRSDPNADKKFCEDRVHVATDAGPQSLCNLARMFGETPRVGDRLDIRGRSTWFGQTVEVIGFWRRQTDG